MKNLLNPLLIALISASASASASAQPNYCRYSETATDMWDVANVALGLVPGVSAGFSASVAVADIMLGNAVDKCNGSVTIEDVMSYARWIGHQQAETAISASIAGELAAVRSLPAISQEHDLDIRLNALVQLEGRAAELSAGRGANHLSLISVLKMQVLTELVNRSFEFNTTTEADAWGLWFSNISSYIQQADISLKNMDKAIADYRGYVYANVGLDEKCIWNPTEKKVIFFGYIKDGAGKEIAGSRMQFGSRNAIINGQPYCFIMNSERETLRNRFTDAMRDRAWQKNNFGKIRGSVQSLRNEVVKTLNRRNLLHKAPVRYIQGPGNASQKTRLARVTDGIHGEGHFGNVMSYWESDQYQTDGSDLEGRKNVEIEVPGLPYPTPCPPGGSSHPSRWAVVGIGFRAQVSKAKNQNVAKQYTVKAYRKDGSTDARLTKKITVSDSQRNYYFSLLTQPYNEAIHTAPLLSKITIEGSAGDDFELDEVYAIVPNIGVGMTAEAGGNSQVLGTSFGAIDASHHATPPELKPTRLFTMAHVLWGSWVGTLAKPAKLGQIEIQIHPDTPSKYYMIKLFDKYGALKYTFPSVRPDSTGVWRSPVCGSPHDLHWVKRVEVRANDNGPFILDEFRARTFAFEY